MTLKKSMWDIDNHGYDGSLVRFAKKTTTKAPNYCVAGIVNLIKRGGNDGNHRQHHAFSAFSVFSAAPAAPATAVVVAALAAPEATAVVPVL